MYNIAQESSIRDFSHNFGYKNKVFILDEITTENTSHLLADLAEMIEYEKEHSKKIEWFINSPGGDVSACKSLIAFMILANIHGIANYTYVIGEAGSSASIISPCPCWSSPATASWSSTAATRSRRTSGAS